MARNFEFIKMKWNEFVQSDMAVAAAAAATKKPNRTSAFLFLACIQTHIHTNTGVRAKFTVDSGVAPTLSHRSIIVVITIILLTYLFSTVCRRLFRFSSTVRTYIFRRSYWRQIKYTYIYIRAIVSRRIVCIWANIWFIQRIVKKVLFRQNEEKESNQMNSHRSIYQFRPMKARKMWANMCVCRLLSRIFHLVEILISFLACAILFSFTRNQINDNVFRFSRIIHMYMPFIHVFTQKRLGRERAREQKNDTSLHSEWKTAHKFVFIKHCLSSKYFPSPYTRKKFPENHF